VLKALQAKPHTKEELRQAAEHAGYDVDGRSIHATTVNLLRGGKIIEINGDYSVAPEWEAAQAH
jgi:hypothetical protein